MLYIARTMKSAETTKKKLAGNRSCGRGRGRRRWEVGLDGATSANVLLLHLELSERSRTRSEALGDRQVAAKTTVTHRRLRRLGGCLACCGCGCGCCRCRCSR